MYPFGVVTDARKGAVRVSRSATKPVGARSRRQTRATRFMHRRGPKNRAASSLDEKSSRAPAIPWTKANERHAPAGLLAHGSRPGARPSQVSPVAAGGETRLVHRARRLQLQGQPRIEGTNPFHRIPFQALSGTGAIIARKRRRRHVPTWRALTDRIRRTRAVFRRPAVPHRARPRPRPATARPRPPGISVAAPVPPTAPPWSASAPPSATRSPRCRTRL